MMMMLSRQMGSKEVPVTVQLQNTSHQLSSVTTYEKDVDDEVMSGVLEDDDDDINGIDKTESKDTQATESTKGSEGSSLLH